MSRLRKRLTQRQKEGRKAFVAYLTAGDPHLDELPGLVAALIHGGVDVIELGIPFSDPLADGPTNQRAAERALASGTTLTAILEKIKALRAVDDETPIVVFSYLNPIYQMGYEAFARKARDAGADGVLIVDLPPEEAEDYRSKMQDVGLDTIFLASPTSDGKRLRLVNQLSSGFVYYVSRTGVTGVQSELSESLGSEMKLVRQSVQKPVMVGFGISTAEQAIAAAQMGDGIIIGSAIVKLIEEGQSPAARREKVFGFAQKIRTALDRHFA